jgi:hypothetical protein
MRIIFHTLQAKKLISTVSSSTNIFTTSNDNVFTSKERERRNSHLNYLVYHHYHPISKSLIQLVCTCFNHIFAKSIKFLDEERLKVFSTLEER